MIGLALLAALATSPASLTVDAQLFASHASEFAEGDDNFNAFSLDRAQLGGAAMTRGEGLRGGGRLLVEAVRSAAPESLVGVAGNSLVLRVREGYGELRHPAGPGEVELRLGLVPDPWIALLEALYPLRGVDAVLAERSGDFDASDLGATVAYDLPALRVVIGALNGEGRAEVEQNAAKNLMAFARLRVARLEALAAQVDVLGGYRWGSTGVADARAHRVVAAATLTAQRLGAGVEYLRADGRGARGDLGDQGFGAFAYGAPVPWLGLVGRFDWLDTDRDADDATARRLTAGLYSDLLGAAPDGELRLHLLYQRDDFGRDAGAIPAREGANDVQRLLVRLTLRGRWEVM